MSQIPYDMLSTISVLGDTRYLPAEVDIDNIGIGISSNTLSTLELNHPNVNVIVGERSIKTSEDSIHHTYGLIVDNHGVLVNSPIRNQTTDCNQYALQVEGSMYVSGSLHASNLVLDIAISENIMALASVSASNPWRFVNREANTNAIFYDGNVTLGNEPFATVNRHPFFVVESADRDIGRTHIAIANTDLSELNIGILGNSPDSPVVFNSAQAPIEFNVGRTQEYYANVYQRYQTVLNDDGESVLQLVPAEVPMYGMSGTGSAASMTIDKRGNVGIHMAETPTFSYDKREVPENRDSYDPDFIDSLETMAFAVNGPMFASNILIYDPDTNTARDINQIYARVNGNFLPANQVNAGDFAKGDYVFPGSLSIDTTTQVADGYGFAVGTKTRFEEDVVFDQNIIASRIESPLLVNTDTVDFRGTLGVTGITNTYGDLVVHKGISVAETQFDGSISYKNVQFQIYGDELSNINYFGNGVTTRGQLGVGIEPYVRDDNPNNMLTIRNRVIGKPKMYEIEVEDLREINFRKTAFLGHTDKSAERQIDGSFVISTPSKTDPRYLGNIANSVQNIYLYPGQDLSDQSAPLIREANPPIFGAFEPIRSFTPRAVGSTDTLGRCAINTFNPIAELHVVGSIALTNDLIRIDAAGNQTTVGIWDNIVSENVNSVTGETQYKGIQYINPNAPHVGINTIPSIEYGAVIAGKVKSTNGYFTANDEEIISWIRPNTNKEVPYDNNAPILYSQGPIGIGITTPSNVIEIKQRGNGPTFVHIISSDDDLDPRTGISIASGNGNDSHTWYLQDNLETNAFEVFAATNGVQLSATEQADEMRALQVVRNVNYDTYNTFINRTSEVDLTVLSNVNPNAALTINGDLNVIGNVYATGNYHSSNIVIASSNIQSLDETNAQANNLGIDDIMIAGHQIHILPKNGGSLIVGADSYFINNVAAYDKPGDSVPMRIHNSSLTSFPVVASLTTTQARCFIEFRANNRRLWLGLENNRLAVKRIDNNNKETPILGFADVEGSEGLGINELAPKALLHITNTSSNQLRITRTMNNGTVGAPSIQLETLKTTSTLVDSRVWSVYGPNIENGDNLSLLYSDNGTNNNLGTELFTFSREGNLGIGNTQPEFALDIKSTTPLGGIRLWSTDTEATPQLIFQSGQSPDFGGDNQTDFRMLTSSNEFQFNAQTLSDGVSSGNAEPIMKVNAAGKIGFGIDPYTGANEDFIRINVKGGINVEDQLYIKGIPLFDSQQRDGFTFNANNIFVIPDAEEGGSFLVNPSLDNTTGTCNLFQIYVDAFDPNDEDSQNISRGIVLDGRGDEVQLTFRTHDTETATAVSHLYRQWQNRDTFGIEYLLQVPPQEKVDFSHDGWNDVVKWETADNQFTMINHGDIQLTSSNPQVLFGSAIVGQSNGHLHLATEDGKNIGIGLDNPAAYVHIRNANATAGVPALYVEHIQEDSNHLAVFGALDDPDLVITANGRIGVGVGNIVEPTVAAEIAGVLAVDPGSETAPAIVYRDDLGTGFWSPELAQTAYSADGIEMLRFDDNGKVGIGTTVPLAHLHINTTNTSKPSVRIDYEYTSDSNEAPIFEMVSSNVTVFVATNNNRIGFGTEATTADFQVAQQFQFENEGQFDECVFFNSNIVTDGDFRCSGTVTQDSDRRLKTDLQIIDNALDRIDKLTGYTFTVIATDKRSTGLIAQDVEGVLPEAVDTDENDILGVAYGNMMGLVMQAIKELRAEVKEIKKAIGLNVI